MAARIACSSARPVAAASCATGSQPPTSLVYTADRSSPRFSSARRSSSGLPRVTASIATIGAPDAAARLKRTAGFSARRSSSAWSGRTPAACLAISASAASSLPLASAGPDEAPRPPNACSCAAPGTTAARIAGGRTGALACDVKPAPSSARRAIPGRCDGISVDCLAGWAEEWPGDRPWLNLKKIL